MTVTGTPVVNISYAGATACIVSPGTLVESQAISFNFTTGAYSLTFPNSNNNTAKNVNFTGFTGTWAARASTTNIFYGNLTLSSGMAYTGGTGALSFNATSGTQILTTNAVTIDSPLTVNGAGGTLQLADAFNGGATRTCTLTAGTLNLNNQTLTTGLFSSSNANARTLAFGSTGSIRLNAAGGTLWTTATTTNFAYTGTSNVTIDNLGAVATTLTPGSLTEAQALNFNIISGSYTLTITNTASFKNLNFVASGPTGFAGTIATHTADITIYGNLTLSSGMTLAAATVGFIFRATSGTQILTSNGKTFDNAMAQNGVGGTLQLADAFAMGSARTFNFINGTFDGNSKTMTGATALSASGSGITAFKNMNTSIVFNHTASTMTMVGDNTTGKVSTISGSIDLNGYTWTATGFGTNVGTKSLTFNGGTLLLTGPYAPTFDNFNPTGFTTVAGTGTGYIRMNAAAAKTFFGNGSTFNCILSNDGAGALTIQNSNTFLGITNGVSPTAFIFTAGTTQTVGSWTVSGTSTSARVTITSTTAGTAANLVKTGGGTVSSNYLSLKDSAATPSLLTWYAGPLTNSVNVSGNSGWIFLAPPGGAYTITALNGTYTLNGQSVGLYRNRTLTSSNGSYNQTGQSATLTRDRSLTSAYGAYALSGQSISITRDRSLTSSYGAYSLTGQAANLVRGRNLIGAYGSYSLTGQDAVLVYASGTSYNITASAGSYTLNGQSASIYRNRSLTGNYGAYAVTGQTADIYRSRKLGADFGSYALIGSDATVVFGRVLLGSAGDYAVAGQDATILKTSLLLLDSGLYSLTGQAVNIAYSGEPIVESVQYLIEIRSFTERRRI
ncbi:hypothetical protein UFOVP165_21 [uncultured Caudovirales phage]|uniref:Uncharacterized protein n=1 Tax=uncultured Caudovirales phage TaxID=2100421 RepID=A0A6J7WAX7_9CAUD|nr:hypothetical protein UFOVP72_8 [uncultured Caudovirales phage]CAB5187246.1 hypothetical protein UFOVP165_21 [uncultured Caudovirales phage]